MFPILFRDDRFVIIDKPAGLPVHAGPSGGASVEDSFPLLSRRRNGPWLAHRLDTDTSGCLVIAFKLAALHLAQAQFSGGSAEKTYWAVTVGGPLDDAGIVSAPLLKVSNKKGWQIVVHESGQKALTEWRVLARCSQATLLELKPRTGRTHQVRVHCASLGCPILGDPVYGDPPEPGIRLHLLARSIDLHVSPPVVAQAEPSPDMCATMARLSLSNHAGVTI